MKKLTVYGLPLNPLSALDKLQGASFCVSYATREKLGRQIDDAIRLVGDQGVLLVDNGAFSLYHQGVSTMDESYLEGFEAWAMDILERCPQAVAVIPDVIDGTEEQNANLIAWSQLPTERTMAIWHLNESIDSLIHRCESGRDWLGFGSAGQYWKPGTPEWHARIQEAFAAIEAWHGPINERGFYETGYVRPRIHMMRAQALAHLYPFDSSDSTNVAVNHNRQSRKGEPLPAFAARVDARIQASAGPEAPHQLHRPLVSPEARTVAWLRQTDLFATQPDLFG